PPSDRPRDARSALGGRQYPLHHSAGPAPGPPLSRPKWNFAGRSPSKAFILRTLDSSTPPPISEPVVHASIGKYARRTLSALCCAVAILTAGCHGHPSTSGYGIMWVTLTDEPGDFTSYIVTIGAVTLTIDLNVAASSLVDATSSPPVVRVRPYLTAGYLPDNTKLTRVRGPLINSSTDVSTYTVYVRPFYDEANNIG